MCSGGIVKEKAVDFAKRGNIFIREMIGGKKKARNALHCTSSSKQAKQNEKAKCCPMT